MKAGLRSPAARCLGLLGGTDQRALASPTVRLMDWNAVASTLVGVFAGGFIGFAANWAQWKRQERSRWQDDRRAVFSRFMAASEAYESAVSDLQRDPSAMGNPHAIDRTQLDDRYLELQRSMSEVLLLASPPVTEAALKLAGELVPTFLDLPPNQLDVGPYAWSMVDPPNEYGHREELSGTKRAFLARARSELGLKSHASLVGLPGDLD